MTVVDADLAALDPDLSHDDLVSLVSRRVSGRFTIDEWGLDRDLLVAASLLARLRWSVQVEGERSLPEIGPALLVHTRCLGLSEPAVLSVAVGQAVGRPLRAADYLGGAPGLLGSLARRLGSVPRDGADLRSLLRAGEIVAAPLGRELRHRFHVGPVPPAPLEVALAAGAPIIPVAVRGLEVGRRWTVSFGRPIPTRRRRSVVDASELAVATRERLQTLVTETRR